MATVERREQTPGRVRYRVRWWADGKQRSKTFQNHADAKRFAAVLGGDLVNGSYYDPKAGAKTVESFAKDWFPTVLDLRPSSLAGLHTSVFVHIIPEFGMLPLSAVTHSHIQQWVTRNSQKYSASAVRKQLFALRRILSVAQRQGLIKDNPANGISLPSLPKTEQRFLTREEINQLVTSIHPRYKAMVLLAVYGGFRFGELCALKRGSINVERSTVRITESLIDVGNIVKCGPPKTKTSVRTVTVPRSVMDEFAKHLDNYTGKDPGSFVFTFQNGSVIRRAWFRSRVWVPALKKAGLEGLRFHDLRHTFVSLWVALGRNAKEVSKVAGHSSVAFTLDRYGHLYDSDDDGLADSLDRLLA